MTKGEGQKYYPERNADTAETWNLCGICNEKSISGKENGFNKMQDLY